MSAPSAASDGSGPPLPGVPGPLSFTTIAVNAVRLYGRKPLPLVAAFLIVYVLGFALGLAISRLGNAGGIVVNLGLAAVVSIGLSFSTAFSAIVLADAVVGRRTDLRDALATLRVHAKELIPAGLLAMVIGFPLEVILPFISLTIVGPPIVAQVISLEHRSFREALSRTLELLRGQWARASLYILGAALVVLLPLYVFLFYALPIAVPFFSAASLLIYLDLRARAEGLDLDSFSLERDEAMGDASDPNPG